MHRGRPAVQAKARGLYLDEKMDLLVRYLVVGPFLSLMQRFGRNGTLVRVFAALFGHRVEAVTLHPHEGGRAGRELEILGLGDAVANLSHQHRKARQP